MKPLTSENKRIWRIELEKRLKLAVIEACIDGIQVIHIDDLYPETKPERKILNKNQPRIRFFVQKQIDEKNYRQFYFKHDFLEKKMKDITPITGAILLSLTKSNIYSNNFSLDETGNFINIKNVFYLEDLAKEFGISMPPIYAFPGKPQLNTAQKSGLFPKNISLEHWIKNVFYPQVIDEKNETVLQRIVVHGIMSGSILPSIRGLCTEILNDGLLEMDDPLRGFLELVNNKHDKNAEIMCAIMRNIFSEKSWIHVRDGALRKLKDVIFLAHPFMEIDDDLKDDYSRLNYLSLSKLKALRELLRMEKEIASLKNELSSLKTKFNEV